MLGTSATDELHAKIMSDVCLLLLVLEQLASHLSLTVVTPDVLI